MNTAQIIAIVILTLLLVTFGPIVTIWALNTIFPVLAIPTNLATWFAVLWLFVGSIHSATK